MAVLGIRCTKDTVYIAVLEGCKASPVITDSERARIKLTSLKTADSRAEVLHYLKRDFSQIIEKYKPLKICYKRQESFAGSHITSIVQKGELEGIIQELCFEKGIDVQAMLYSQTKKSLGFVKQDKVSQLGKIETIFSIQISNDYIKEAILCGWAILD